MVALLYLLDAFLGRTEGLDNFKGISVLHFEYDNALQEMVSRIHWLSSHCLPNSIMGLRIFLHVVQESRILVPSLMQSAVDS